MKRKILIIKLINEGRVQLEVDLQMDMFDGLMSPGKIGFERIMRLEQRQENLRRGLFKRFGDHEKKINKISVLMEEIVETIRGSKPK